MYIYASQRLLYNCTYDVLFGTHYSCSANGWITRPTFIDWLAKSVFLASLPLQHSPVLLILDGHKSHISYEVCVNSSDNGVHLLKLPPRLAHLFQTFDLAVFKLITSAWNLTAAEFIHRERQAIT